MKLAPGPFQLAPGPFDITPGASIIAPGSFLIALNWKKFKERAQLTSSGLFLFLPEYSPLL